MPNEMVADYGTDFLGGQDASNVPAKIDKSAFYAGINISTKNGVIAPRPPFTQKTLTFPDGGVPKPNLQIRTYKQIFEEGRFQAEIPYSIGLDHYLLCVVSGVMFLINQSTWVVKIINIADGSYISEGHERVNFSDAGKYLVIFDYPAYPVIITNGVARRSNPANFEVPVSVNGTYNQNRLFVSNAGNEFTAGDPSGSLAAPNAPITFLEVDLPSTGFTGQSFQLTTDYNNSPITAMTFLQMTDTSTGIGPLIVSTNKKIYSYQSQLPRAQWQAGSFGTAFVAGSGIVGPRAFAHVNSDFYYMSTDGQLRSAAMSRSEQGKWSHMPVSREVQNWLKFSDESLMPYGVMTYFDNKVLVSCNPYRTVARTIAGFPTIDVTHGGFAVIEFDNISTLKTNLTTGGGSPSWAGLWTGVRPMAIVVSEERCFVVSKDYDAINKIYELEKGSGADIVNKRRRNVVSKIYTRAFDFGDPFQNKEIHSLDLAPEEVEGNLNLKVEYRPSHTKQFNDWRTFKHIAPFETCGIPDSQEIHGLEPHAFREVNLGSPEKAECDPVNRIDPTYFRRLQLKFTVSANYWEIREFKIKALQRPQSEQISPDEVCKQYPTVALPKECDIDWVIPGETLCPI